MATPSTVEAMTRLRVVVAMLVATVGCGSSDASVAPF